MAKFIADNAEDVAAGIEKIEAERRAARNYVCAKCANIGWLRDIPGPGGWMECLECRNRLGKDQPKP